MTNLVETEDITRRFTESLILVELRLGTFSNSKTDKEESKKTRDSNNIDNDKVARVVKTLLPDSKILLDMRKHDKAIWAIVDRYGAPYTKGVRMVPAVRYLELTSDLRAAFSRRDDLIREFAAEYVAQVDAAKGQLKTLFKEKDYPPVSQIVSKFSHSLNVTPVANPSDLKLSVLDEAAAAIQEAVNDSFKDRTENLAPFIRELLLSKLSHLSSFLQTPEAKWTESLFGNVLAAADKAKGLNILNDDEINNAVFEIHDKLDRPRESVKNDDQLRRTVLADCNTIIESLGGTPPPAYVPKKSDTTSPVSDDVENVPTDEQIDEAAQQGAEIYAALNWA